MLTSVGPFSAWWKRSTLVSEVDAELVLLWGSGGPGCGAGDVVEVVGFHWLCSQAVGYAAIVGGLMVGVWKGGRFGAGSAGEQVNAV